MVEELSMDQCDTLRRSSDVIVIADPGSISATLIRRFEMRGLQVELASSVEKAKSKIFSLRPAFVLTDVKFDDGDGFQILAAVQAEKLPTRIVVYSCYLNARMAVRCACSGAVDVVHKPCEVALLEEIVIGNGDGIVPADRGSLHPDFVRHEYIRSVLEECGGNVAGTARRLRMHRRTLQRHLIRHSAVCEIEVGANHVILDEG